MNNHILNFVSYFGGVINFLDSGIILDFQKSCKDGTENSHTPFPSFPLMLHLPLHQNNIVHLSKLIQYY